MYFILFNIKSGFSYKGVDIEVYTGRMHGIEEKFLVVKKPKIKDKR